MTETSLEIALSQRAKELVRSPIEHVDLKPRLIVEFGGNVNIANVLPYSLIDLEAHVVVFGEGLSLSESQTGLVI